MGRPLCRHGSLLRPEIAQLRDHLDTSLTLTRWLLGMEMKFQGPPVQPLANTKLTRTSLGPARGGKEQRESRLSRQLSTSPAQSGDTLPASLQLPDTTRHSANVFERTGCRDAGLPGHRSPVARREVPHLSRSVFSSQGSGSPTLGTSSLRAPVSASLKWGAPPSPRCCEESVSEGQVKYGQLSSQTERSVALRVDIMVTISRKVTTFLRPSLFLNRGRKQRDRWRP